MDPVTAFSLTCGIIQITNYSFKVLAKCKDIHENGSLSQYNDLEIVTKQLSDVHISLQLPTVSCTTVDREQVLLDVAKKCAESARQLVAKLDTLRLSDPQSKREATKKTIKALWDRGEIEILQKCLDGYRKMLDTQILVTLRERFDLLALRQSQGFDSLDVHVRSLVKGLIDGPKGLEELADLVSNEHERTRDHISHEIRRHEQRSANEEFRTRLLHSLHFPEIHRRQESIKDAHKKTFEWIFDQSSQSLGRWNNFVDWLEDGQGIYWINGKAGSGKSTLMRFLCQEENERTMESLRKWSGGKNTILSSFFFWSAGTSLEKSIEGLLRSVIWQIMNYRPDVVPTSYQASAGPIALWTERGLRKTFKDALRQISIHSRVCLFIDGLDEFVGDLEALIDDIQDVTQGSDVKACVSSRPSPEFGWAFGRSAKLRLQDLTEGDIQRYVSDKLQAASDARSASQTEPHWLKTIEESLLARAGGVFLWVELAVKDQIRGFRNGDSVEQLNARLERLPDVVEDIYDRMLKAIDEPYRAEACRCLQVALYKPGISLMGMALICHSGLQEMVEAMGRMTQEEIAIIRRFTPERITVICAGLLECTERSSATASELWSPDIQEAAECLNVGVQAINSVDFIHRTAFDFIKGSAHVSTLSAFSDSSSHNYEASYATSLIALLRLIGYVPCAIRWVQQTGLPDVMKAIAMLEKTHGVVDMKFYELTHRIMCNIDKEHEYRQDQGVDVDDEAEEKLRCTSEQSDWDLDTPWCTRWGNNLTNRYSMDKLSSDSPRTFGDWPTGRSSYTELIKRPLSFLGFAAISDEAMYDECGLPARYVQQRCELIKNRIDIRTANNLLCCALSTYLWSPLVSACLESGTDPNALTEHSGYKVTLWQWYLAQIYVRSGISFDRSPIQPNVIALINNGADKNAVACAFHTIAISSAHWLYKTNNSLSDEPESMIRYCRFYIEISALAWIQLRFYSKSASSRPLEDCMAEKGARFHYRCHKVELTQNCPQEYDMSEQDSSIFLELLEDCYRSRSDAKENEHRCDEKSSVVHKIVLFCNMLEERKRQAEAGIQSSESSSVGFTPRSDNDPTYQGGDSLLAGPRCPSRDHPTGGSSPDVFAKNGFMVWEDSKPRSPGKIP